MGRGREREKEKGEEKEEDGWWWWCTCCPAMAATWAMPDPICPPPTTARHLPGGGLGADMVGKAGENSVEGKGVSLGEG